jgi:hypothetical protein
MTSRCARSLIEAFVTWLIQFRQISVTHVMRGQYNDCIMNVYSKVPEYGHLANIPEWLKFRTKFSIILLKTRVERRLILNDHAHRDS